MEHLHALLSFSFIAPHKYPPPGGAPEGGFVFAVWRRSGFFTCGYSVSPLLLTEESVAHIAAYGWSGNVRELENCIQLHVNLAEGASIVIPPLASTPNTAGTSPRPTTSPPARESTASTAPQ